MSEGGTPAGPTTSPHAPISTAHRAEVDREEHCTSDEVREAAVLDDSTAGSAGAKPTVASTTAASLALASGASGVTVEPRVLEASRAAVEPAVAVVPGVVAPSGGTGAVAVAAVAGEEKEGTAVPKVPEKASAAVQDVPDAVAPCLCPIGSEGAHKTVTVESRCWPGSNKPGGVARIVKRYDEREEIYGEVVDMVYFDVKYLLGGSEKRVKATYVSCTPNETVARQPRPRDRFTVPVSEGRHGRRTPSRSTPSRPVTPVRKRKSTASPASSPSSRASSSSPCGDVTNDAMISTGGARGGGSRGGAKAKGKGNKVKHSEQSSRGAEKKSAHKSTRRKGDGSMAPRIDLTVGRHKQNKPNSFWAASMEEGENAAPTMVDLTPLEPIVSKRPSAPLSERRMHALTAALATMFDKSGDSKLPMQGVKAGVNKAVIAPTEAFEDGELELGLKHLEEVEGKIVIDNGNMYLI